MPISGGQALSFFKQSVYSLLPIQADHGITVETRPNHHHDPFDRILVAQALTEHMRLVTHDAKVEHYRDTILTI